MKKTVLIMLVFAVVSCNLLDGGYFLGTKRSDVLRENNYRGKVSEPEPESKQEKDTIIYVTGVDFPIGYDWRRDTSYGNVRSSIVLFANGKKIKSIPVGDEYFIGPEPDRHRLVEDKIYTDCSFSGETIIKRDAEEVFRYKGEETIKGFMVYENNVYTLGKRLDGTGFTFRKSGELIFEGKNGEILGNICDKPTSNGAIFYDNGICFIYYRLDWKEGEPEKRWFIVRDGNEKEIEITGDYNILDICVIRGEIVALRWADFDPDAATIRVSKARKKGTEEYEGTTKTTYSARTVTLSPAAVENLLAWKNLLSSRMSERGIRVTKTSYLFRSLKDESQPMTLTALTHIFADLKKRLHLPKDLRFHSFRHTHATLLAEQEISAKKIQVRLGHASAAFTMDRYVHNTAQMQDGITDKIIKCEETYSD